MQKFLSRGYFKFASFGKKHQTPEFAIDHNFFPICEPIFDQFLNLSLSFSFSAEKNGNKLPFAKSK
jgi:hypothetical protein